MDLNEVIMRAPSSSQTLQRCLEVRYVLNMRLDYGFEVIVYAYILYKYLSDSVGTLR